MKTFTIKMKDSEDQTVDGHDLGSFFAHKSLEDPEYWTLTHKAAKGSVSTKLVSLAQCRMLAKDVDFMEVCDLHNNGSLDELIYFAPGYLRAVSYGDSQSFIEYVMEMNATALGSCNGRLIHTRKRFALGVG